MKTGRRKTTLAEYRESVMAAIEYYLNGKQKFKLDEMVVQNSFEKRHHPTVPAKCMIETAKSREKRKGKNRG